MNPTTRVTHMTHGTTGECLGLHVWLWCPGCESAHAPTFRCPEHGGPATGPVWEGDPYSQPFSMEPSYKTMTGQDMHTVCHSFIRQGQWEFLSDCLHSMRGFHDLVPLPDWLAD